MREVRLHDTRSGELMTLAPRDAGRVGIYACGPTVYSRIHIGNARPFVVFSLLKRFLEHEGYEVTLVVNITDVNDKIYDAARARARPSARARRRDDRAATAPTRARSALGRPDHEPLASRDDRADRRLYRGAGRRRARLSRSMATSTSACAQTTATAACRTAGGRHGPGRGRGGRAAQGGSAGLRAVEGGTSPARTPPGTRPGAAGGRAGTSSARRWPRSCSASALTSMAAALTSSSHTTRTRPRRRARRAVASSRGCGCTTA